MAGVCVQVLALRAPHRGASRPTTGTEVDIWAVGILAYELMLGGPPFESDTKEETYDKIQHDTPFYPSLWTEEAKSFLTQASISKSYTSPFTQSPSCPTRHPFILIFMHVFSGF